MARPKPDEETLINVARLRYENGIPQNEIARNLQISEATVSRYLKLAMELGIVEIRVATRAFRNKLLETQLMQRFNLVSAIVVDRRSTDVNTVQLLGNAVFRGIEDLVLSDTVIGVSNGETVASVAAAGRLIRADNLSVVTLIGGVGRAEEASQTGEICRTLARRIGARAWVLPVPAVVDTAEAAATLRSTSGVSDIFELIGRVSIAIVGIGAMTEGSSTFRHGLFPSHYLQTILAAGAVGSMCGRFYNADGQVLHSDIEARTLSLSLDALSNVTHCIAVALGPEKVPAIRAAMRGRLINALGTDAETAALLCEG
ncbi:sugar-binding transcriptional regulator [Kaistia granuli]|uniref:sugar-binding transcriptional regulator n=1 Tax=Kaistia granuli TaxID=363259 RepID=UPI000360CCF6|nr:sugar-binding domain-containing protein [Kaistia granuli]